jgi:hypothetical protein
MPVSEGPLKSCRGWTKLPPDKIARKEIITRAEQVEEEDQPRKEKGVAGK